MTALSGTRTMLTTTVLCLLVLSMLALGGCGKKGPTSPPGPPDQITWPRTYPTR